MSDVKQVLSVMNEDARRGPLARPLLIARTVAIITAVIGATPTAYQFYQSWKHDIPYSEVPHRLSQYELFVANIDCNPSYKALTAANGTRIDAAACPKTGDISVRIVAPGNQAYHQWVAFKQLQKTATARSAWLDLFVASAHAQEGKPAPAAVQTAQAPSGAPAPAGGSQVVCQSLQPKAMVVRIVSEAGKCYREIISAIHGKTEKRDEVPCNTQCPAPGKG